MTGKVPTFLPIDVVNIYSQEVCTWQEWSMLTAVEDTTLASCSSPTVPVPQRIRDLSHKDLRAQLVAAGALVGAVTPATS